MADTKVDQLAVQVGVSYTVKRGVPRKLLFHPPGSFIEQFYRVRLWVALLPGFPLCL